MAISCTRCSQGRCYRMSSQHCCCSNRSAQKKGLYFSTVSNYSWALFEAQQKQKTRYRQEKKISLLDRFKRGTIWGHQHTKKNGKKNPKIRKSSILTGVRYRLPQTNRPINWQIYVKWTQKSTVVHCFSLVVFFLEVLKRWRHTDWQARPAVGGGGESVCTAKHIRLTHSEQSEKDWCQVVVAAVEQNGLNAFLPFLPLLLPRACFRKRLVRKRG